MLFYVVINSKQKIVKKMEKNKKNLNFIIKQFIFVLKKFQVQNLISLFCIDKNKVKFSLKK